MLPKSITIETRGRDISIRTGEGFCFDEHVIKVKELKELPKTVMELLGFGGRFLIGVVDLRNGGKKSDNGGEKTRDIATT